MGKRFSYSMSIGDSNRLNALFAEVERRLKAVEDAIKSVQEALKEYGPAERRD